MNNMHKSVALGILWVSNLQYFAVQAIVAGAWKEPFSLSTNYISDLGNTVCGVYDQRYVCSPLHDLMNASFIVLGITQLAGAYFIAPYLQQGKLRRLATASFVLAGSGTILVGLFPENSLGPWHLIGAALPFALGNLGLILYAKVWDKISPGMQKISVALGSIGLVCLGLFLSRHYFGLGAGGMERFVAYPQTIWMIIVGWWLVRTKSTAIHAK